MDENNIQFAAPYLGEASSFAASGDTIPAADIELEAGSAWWQVVGAPAAPGVTDAYRAIRGPETKRVFRTDTFGAGSILFSQYVDVPASLTVATMLWDLGTDPAGSNQAAGGYGLQLNKVSTQRRLEFLWRNAGSAAAPVALLSIDIDAPGVVYPPIIAPFGTNVMNGKYGSIFHFGAVLNFLPEGRYIDLYLDGNIVGTEMLAAGENVSINEGAGLTLWATSRAPADGAGLTKVMNDTDTGFRTSSFFAQRLETDRAEKAAQIMGDAMMLRQAKPASAKGL